MNEEASDFEFDLYDDSDEGLEHLMNVLMEEPDDDAYDYETLDGDIADELGLTL